MSFRNVILVGMTIVGFAASMNGVQAKEETFTIGDDKSRDNVSFNSNAPIEVIDGTTHSIKGEIKLDDSLDLGKKPLEASFDVDLASIDTGIALRNEHMRDNFLETKKFPKATFKLTSISGASKLLDNKKVELKANGEFTVHGVTVKKTVPVEVTYFKKCPGTESKMPGCELLQINAKFPVAFKDHKINRPEIVFQKLADTVFVTVNATAFRKVN